MTDKPYSVRLFRYDDDYVHNVEARDMEDAAEKAMEHWRRHSHWSGGPPHHVECEVRLRAEDEDTDETPTTGWERVDVEVDWSPNFHAYKVRNAT
jgi:hypothetical protein